MSYADLQYIDIKYKDIVRGWIREHDVKYQLQNVPNLMDTLHKQRKGFQAKLNILNQMMLFCPILNVLSKMMLFK